MSDTWTFTIEPVAGYTEQWTEEERAIADDIIAAIRSQIPRETKRFLSCDRVERSNRRAILDTLLVAQQADVLQFGDRAEEGYDVLCELAEILVVVAAQPGGVDFLGHHWCLFHDLCGTPLLEDLLHESGKVA